MCVYTFIGLLSGVLLCHPLNVYALDSVSFKVAKISADNWSLKNALLKITQLGQTAQISLESAILILPPPLNDITALRIQCQKITWRENYLDCAKGRARFTSASLQTQDFNFSLRVDSSKSKLEISGLTLFGTSIAINAQEKSEKWQLNINAQHINLDALHTLFAMDLFEINQGLADIDIQLTGERDLLQHVHVSGLLKQLNVQDSQGRIASENMELKTAFSAVKRAAGWQWHTTQSILNGGLYVEPVYLQMTKDNALLLTADGVWQAGQETIQVNAFELQHADLLTVEGNMQLNYPAGNSIEAADLWLYIPNLSRAAPIYILPFLESKALAGIDLAGSLKVQLKMQQDSLSQAHMQVKDLMLDDHLEKKIAIYGGNAQINWYQQQHKQVSFINWHQLNIHAIPFDAGRLDFISFAKHIELLKAADLSVLGGVFSINQFSLTAAEKDEDTTVQFSGSVNHLSLEKLSTALDWAPLSGTISGYIPAVSYQDKTLSLNGELKMQVFGGEVRIKNLASSGLFSDYPLFSTDIDFDHLDLDAITHKFDTGYIEGRLSGRVQNLSLENWQPVSFYAWLGTPDDDKSTHKISQKAVENIASIGGGGAGDVLSKGFLGLFSTFRYDKLGFGCYLHQGVCQLMGVEAVDNGFYLIKGGGLPRIDVIGYNPSLDWNVLLNRLRRITASNEAIIK